jgi:hypothetical protein
MSAIWSPPGWVLQGQIHGLHYLIVLQFYGLVLGVAVLIMRSAEFQPDEILTGD